ncbi:hypothetical protein PVK06_020664 [Gossypium arboreum]|uniref:CCHC-type domain-containing protein n=1 Tax=Gossypium arboreum TaxID=29729 RepID=A0ABR0PN09_GOSAR|nr:hypothetical protein PVK06_020664 [Gossypium arboreum]
MQAIGSTFGGILRSDIKDESCRIQILLNARKPLPRGIFITVGPTRKVWLPFKYESLPNFCFGCGIMSHIAKDCDAVIRQGKVIRDGELPYSVALKPNLNKDTREKEEMGDTLQADLSTEMFTEEVKTTKTPHGMVARKANMGYRFVESDGREETVVVGAILNTSAMGNRGNPKQP